MLDSLPENFEYYIYAIAIVILGLIALKKAAGCMIRIVVTFAIIIILAAIYWIGFYGQ